MDFRSCLRVLPGARRSRESDGRGSLSERRCVGTQLEDLRLKGILPCCPTKRRPRSRGRATMVSTQGALPQLDLLARAGHDSLLGRPPFGRSDLLEDLRVAEWRASLVWRIFGPQIVVHNAHHHSRVPIWSGFARRSPTKETIRISPMSGISSFRSDASLFSGVGAPRVWTRSQRAIASDDTDLSSTLLARRGVNAVETRSSLRLRVACGVT